MAKKTLTSGLLGTVTGLSKEAESVSTNSAVAPVEMPKEVVPEIPGQSDPMLMRLWSTISINCTVLGQPWKITCVKFSGK